jgi:predicted ATPase
VRGAEKVDERIEGSDTTRIVTSAPHLPVQLTSFIGSGKTRMTIQLASTVAGEYPHGVYFVSLAPVGDPSLVLPSIAQTIGLHDAREGSLLDHLAGHLRDRTTLLVLDNFEQLLKAARSSSSCRA